MVSLGAVPGNLGGTWVLQDAPDGFLVGWVGFVLFFLKENLQSLMVCFDYVAPFLGLIVHLVTKPNPRKTFCDVFEGRAGSQVLDGWGGLGA